MGFNKIQPVNAGVESGMMGDGYSKLNADEADKPFCDRAKREARVLGYSYEESSGGFLDRNNVSDRGASESGEGY